MSRRSARKLPDRPPTAFSISSPFIIIRAWGIVPWKLDDSSPSSLAKAKTNWPSHWSRSLGVVVAARLVRGGGNDQRVEQLLGVIGLRFMCVNSVSSFSLSLVAELVSW